MKLLQTQLGLVALICASQSAPTSSYHAHEHSGPIAHVKNGSYVGTHSTSYNQDFFLGIPFAQPPIADLRFSNPAPLDTAWADIHEANVYSPACVGYGPSQLGYDVSEDCLYLNIIRPSGVKGPLPVAVWIFGGGFVQGSGVDRRYNMSFIVDRSIQIDQPIMAVTISYRLSAWGFLGSEEVTASGSSNFGIRDQRLALQWIQENIHCFGGDPSKVTIWGQSAGAASVGLQLLAFNGRDDGLFRSAIMQSGGPLALSSETRSTQEAYNNLTESVGCSSSEDSLACLKALPYQTLNAAINTTSLSGVWSPKIDGDIIARHSSSQLADGSFVPVPIIIGANSDEGTSSAPKTITTTEDFYAYLVNRDDLPSDLADGIVTAYPNDPALPLALANLPSTFTPNASYGAQYRRIATYTGDRTFIASRRLAARTWAEAGLPAYSYRFNAIPAWATQFDSATHFVEVAFAMDNVEGVGYAPARTPPFQGKPRSYVELAALMSGDWASFVACGDPSGWAGRGGGDAQVPAWPLYGEDGPRNFGYDANVTSFVEVDDWRSDGIDLILSASRDVYDR